MGLSVCVLFSSLFFSTFGLATVAAVSSKTSRGLLTGVQVFLFKLRSFHALVTLYAGGILHTSEGSGASPRYRTLCSVFHRESMRIELCHVRV